MHTEYFYYFGFIYLAHRLFSVLKAWYYKKSSRLAPKEEVMDESIKLGTDLGAAKDFVKTNGIDMLFVFVNTIWVFSGIWSPEGLYFVLLLVLSLMLLYFRIVRHSTDIGLWFITYILKIAIVTLILFKHWDYI